jgi:glycosyltransferase involved in cell wall biosynthesis
MSNKPNSNKNRKFNILIICRDLYGSLTDSYELSKYLAKNHFVTYLCYDAKKTMLKNSNSVPPGVQLEGVSRKGCFVSRIWKWLYECICMCHKDYDLIYLYYFPLCSLVRLASLGRVFILDIRSGCILSNNTRRILSNWLLKIDSYFFSYINVLSESMRKYLHLSDVKTHTLPLGANPMDIPRKSFSNMHLLYVGTLFNRNLDETIIGFAKYCSEYSDKMNLHYTLVGDSPVGDRQKLLSIVQKLGLQNVIDLPGYIPRDELNSFFEKCNIGVSYIPMVTYYDCQPATKTFEYLFAGMPVIATATTENMKIINEENGVLISDTSEDFYKGLCLMTNNLSKYNSEKIKASVSSYSWDKIMLNYAIPSIERVFDK